MHDKSSSSQALRVALIIDDVKLNAVRIQVFTILVWKWPTSLPKRNVPIVHQCVVSNILEERARGCYFNIALKKCKVGIDWYQDTLSKKTFLNLSLSLVCGRIKYLALRCDGPFASGFSWKNANLNVTWPRSCGRVCSLQFAFERQEGLPAVSDLRQGFLPQKIVQPHVLRHQVAFFICLRCACWISVGFQCHAI